MADLPEVNEWPEGIYQLETSDPVLGGPDGIDNLQGKQLASRTHWLKDQIEKIISGVTLIGKAVQLATARSFTLSGAVTGSASFDGSANANIVVTLANSGVEAGTYPKVQVNAKGLVTGGTALTALDIPALDWSKINSGKPTTLGGYGIVLPTQAQAETGTDNSLPMTPLRVFQAAAQVKRLVTFSANGSWTCPAGVTEVLVDGAGGGGGGSGANGTTNAGQGGGGGGCIRNQYYAVTPGQVYAVTIGKGGAGGALNADGTNGGVTSLGGLLSLSGGGAGSKNGSGFGVGGGWGAQPGGDAFALGGAGGSTFFGLGGKSRLSTGVNGTGYGAGGSGGAPGYAGGPGSDGFISIRW